jgi:hypothetical protein
MSRDGCCGFYLLEQVTMIYVIISILWRMIVRIAILIGPLVILDLDYRCYSLLTEGAFITSVTASDDLRCQTKIISCDYLT